MHAAVRLFSGILLLCWAVSARAQLAVNPGQLDFPLGTIGVISAPLYVTLRNTGNTTLTVVSLTPAGGSYARAGGSCGTAPFTLAAQASCTLGYTFTPIFIGPTSSLLRVTPDIGNFVDFKLVGEGEVGGLRTNPGQLSFPVLAVGATAGPLFVTLSNTSTATLTVVTLTPASGVYARAGGSCTNLPFALAAQASCTLGYTFTPNGVGSVYQTLRASANASEFVDFTLAGEGARGRLVVQPSNMNFFQPIPVGTISGEQVATLSNEGAAPLQVTAIAPAVVPSVASFVRAGGNCPEPPFTINAFTACQIRYVFAPVVVGEVQLDMRFHTNVSSAESMNLRGEGLPGDPVFANGFEGN